MRDLNPVNITETVLETFSGTPSPRFHEIITTVVRHLHDCVRELKLTPDEWLEAIRYLTAVGEACTPNRQEFILLSDTLGVSALVNLLNAHPEGATISSLLGPFFRERAPELEMGSHIAPHDSGELIVVSGRVVNPNGAPIAGARIDVWQASSTGLYDIQGPTPETMDLRGRFRTGPDGRYHFRTVLPVGYGVPMDGPVGSMLRQGGRRGFRPAHIHFMLSAPGHHELVTALYVAGDPHIDADAVFGVSQALVVEPRRSEHESGRPREINYDFVLAAGSREGSDRVGADPSTIRPAAR
jgi:hydroxyquinol 1,2-dioxygenase